MRPRHAGFTLIELMVVIAVIAIIAAIAIPSLLESRKASNEASAIQAIRTLATAQRMLYERARGANGTHRYADGISDLRGLVPESVIQAQGHPGGPTYSGYIFGVLGAVEGFDIAHEFGVICEPASFGKSGDRSFFSDDSGVIRFSISLVSAGEFPTPAQLRAWPPIGS